MIRTLVRVIGLTVTAFAASCALQGIAQAETVAVPTTGCIGAAGNYVCTTGSTGVTTDRTTSVLASPTDACVYVKCVAPGESLVTAPVAVVAPSVNVTSPTAEYLENRIQTEADKVGNALSAADQELQKTGCWATGGRWTYEYGYYYCEY